MIQDINKYSNKFYNKVLKDIKKFITKQQERRQQMEDQSKKQIYIGPTIQHILNTDLLIKNQNKLLLQNKRQILLLDIDSQSMVSSKIDTERILYCTYHQILKIYLIKTVHDIFIVNEAGQSLGKLQLENEPQLMQARFILMLPTQDGALQDPHQRIDKFIYITDENMHISDIKIKFQRGMLKNKQITNFNFQILKDFNKKTQIDPSIVIDAPEWIEKCKLLSKEKYLICYNKHQTMVFQVPTYKHQALNLFLTYRRSSKSQNKITDVAISLKQKYIIFSHQSGTIKIYRFNSSKKYLQQLRGHQKQCQSLFIANKDNKDILYSAGLDNTVRIWNLYQFQELYCLRIDLISQKIILLSEELAFIKFSNFRKACLCNINAYKIEPIMTENKGGKITNLVCDGQWGISLFSNNYAEMFLVNEEAKQIRKAAKQDKQDDQFDIIKKKQVYSEKVQFPLKYGNVQSAAKVRKNQYAIILEKGFSLITLNKDQVKSQNFELKKLVYNQQIQQMYSDSDSSQDEIDQIYNVKTDKNRSSNKYVDNKNLKKDMSPQSQKQENKLIELIHEKLLGTYLFSLIEDWKGIPTAIIITFLTFVTGKSVPMWDMDQKKKIVNNQTKKGRDRNFTILKKVEVQKQKVHAVIGTEKGVIFIIDVEKRSQFQARAIFHSSQVEFIQQFFPKKSIAMNSKDQQLFFVSTEKNKDICFWSISEQFPPNLYCRVSNLKNISHLSLHQSFMLIGQKQGKVSILQLFIQQIPKQDMQSSRQLHSPISPRLRRKVQSRASSSRGGRINQKPSKLLLKQSTSQCLYGHMKSVETGDYLHYKGQNIFLTGSEDCTIKMWKGIQKQLLFQIKIFDPITHLTFLHSGINFIVAHNDQISSLKSQNIPEMRSIQKGFDKNRHNMEYSPLSLIDIKKFFSNEQQDSRQEKHSPSIFRMKIMPSINVQPLNFSFQESLHLLSPKSKISSRYMMSFLSNIPEENDKNEKQINLFQRNLQTPIGQKQKQQIEESALGLQATPSSTLKKKHRVFAKSQQKLRVKKSFRIDDTNAIKEFQYSSFQLPKISTLQQNTQQSKNLLNRKRMVSSFQKPKFIDQMKISKGKSFSFAGKSAK